MYLGTPYSPNLFPMFSIRFRIDIPSPFCNEKLYATGRESAVQSANDILSNMKEIIL